MNWSHTIHVHRGRFQIENPQNWASGSYSFPETEMFTSFLFLTFLPKKSISKIGLTNVLHKLHLRSWQTWVSGFCFFWELSIIQSVGYTATGCLEWGPLSQVPPWPYLHQRSEDWAWRKIVNRNRSKVWSWVRQPLSTTQSNGSSTSSASTKWK